jgi:hypothetical protein
MPWPKGTAAATAAVYACAKGFRRIFSRFEKLDVMFVGFISFALIANGLRLC